MPMLYVIEILHWPFSSHISRDLAFILVSVQYKCTFCTNLRRGFTERNGNVENTVNFLLPRAVTLSHFKISIYCLQSISHV